MLIVPVRVGLLGPPERGGLAESRTQTRSMGLKKAHTWPCSSVGRAPAEGSTLCTEVTLVRFRPSPKTKPLAGSPNGHKDNVPPPSYRPAKKVRAGHLAALPKGHGDGCGKTLCREQATPGEIWD